MVDADGGPPADVQPQLTLELLRQGNDTERAEIPIPQEVQDLYKLYRPSPLRRAERFEKALGTSSRIYFKYEGNNAAGSHKLNTAIAQAYYFKRAGVKRIVTGTGAGQWGSAIAYACTQFGMECLIFMVGVSYRQKPLRAVAMELYGGTVHSSPSELTQVGKNAVGKDPEKLGSLAVATGEAIEIAHASSDTRFAVGSGEGHVLLHQTVIGQEAVQQMAELGEYPDAVVACMGAGSNFAGMVFPFMRDARKQNRSIEFVAAEPIACPKLTRGRFAFDKNDFSGTTPHTKMMTLGRDFLAPGIHAGGLRYHGTSPLLSKMFADGLFKARAVPQTEVMGIASLFARSEGVIVAPESAHALSAAAQMARESRTPRAILVNISGHGHLDLTSYQEFRAGKMDDGAPSEEALERSLAQLDARNAPVNEAT